MHITINAIESCIDILDCMTAEELRATKLADDHLGILSELVLHFWPSTKLRDRMNCSQTWSFRDEIAVIYGISIKAEE